MYLDVLQPGDTFPMMMRKMAIAVGAIAGIFPMMILIQALMGITTPTSSTYPRFISAVIILIGSWIYVKWTHTAPTWLIVFWINSMSVLVLLGNLAHPNAPNGFLQIAIIICVLVCKMHIANLLEVYSDIPRRYSRQ